MTPNLFDRLILRLAQPAAVVGLFESRWSLEQRVKRILEPGRTLMVRSQRGVVLLAFALLATAAVALAAIRPGPAPAVALNADAVADEADEMIRGQVVDEAGNPVAGATVSGAARIGVTTKTVQTGADGRFALPSEDPGRFYEPVRGSADGGERLGISRSAHGRFQEREPVTVVLKPSRPLTVRVFDPAGKSAVDAAVEVASSDGLRYIDPGATDASGVARFRLPADAEIRGVLALKNGVGVGLYQNADASPVFHYKPMPAEVTISLQPARTVSVRAVGPEGEPLAGISIGWTLSLRGNNWVRPTGLLMESTTDAAGMARFSWFPRDGSGALRVVAPKDLLETLPLPLGPRADSADVTLTVPFERKVTVAGRVFHGDGSPARGVKVVAHSDGQPRSGQGAGRTSEDGSYKLSVRAGTLYAIGVVDPDWTAQPLMGITIRPGEQRQGLDLRLIPGTRLHGRVASPSEDSTDVYVRHLGPQLPPELQIPSIGRTRQSFLHWARIGAQGQYEVRLAPGDYEIFVVDRPREPETRHVDGTGELVIDFLQKPKPPVALSGLVVAGGPGGAERPVKAFITLTPVQGAAFRTTTDDTGRFRMMRPDRESALYAQSPDGVAAVKIGPAEKEVKVVLAPPATVTGRIVDVAGRPLAGDGPYLAMESGPGGLPAPRDTHALSKLEADGRYQFRLIPGAEYQLVYVSERETPRVHAHPIKKFRVSGAEKIDVGDFVVPDPPADLKKP